MLLEQIDQTLARLVTDDAGLVVAVSGGPDSVALLLALVRLGRSPLVVAHLNHQLRGAESDADEAFVRELHAQLSPQVAGSIHLCCARQDMASEAATRGENLESTAREARYRWLTDVAREHRLTVVATGHTADDQAETVLHRLLRGAGLQGLRGIAECRPLADGITLVRPMLDVTRADVMAYLDGEGMTARQDSSNADLAFTRNRLRHELLPYLERHFNPGVRAVLNRLAHEASEAFDEEQREVVALLERAERPRAGRMLVLDLATLRQSSRRRVRLLFRHLWQRELWQTGHMTFDHWQRLEALVFDDLTATDLPDGVHVRRRDGVVQLHGNLRGQP
jgi:tRNA(Ile)-lysidine synthase